MSVSRKDVVILTVYKLTLTPDMFYSIVKASRYFFLFLILVSCINKQETSLSENIDFAAYVDPFIGTGFHGHTFPGPVRPYGMVQLSPDTKLNGWDASSGYHYDDNVIYGFSHTHLSGTGIGDLGDILVLPYTGISKGKPIAKFDKSNEKAEVGYYSVEFSNFNVKTELAVTDRVGIHRYQYDDGDQKKILFDVGHILQRTWGHSNLLNELEIVNDSTIRGLKHSSGWAYDHKVYFYAKFSSPFQIDSVNIQNESNDNSKLYQGKSIYAKLAFNHLQKGEDLLVKIAISPVDVVGAKKNMDAELNHWDFDMVKEQTKEAWNTELAKILVSTKKKEDLTIFYTALYHSMVAPMMYEDVDGRYRGIDKKIHTSKEGRVNYTVFSLWDTFRALHPLMTIINEQKSADWVNNLLLKYQQGLILPMWPLASNYTGTMVGYPAVANIADALTKDIPGIDRKLALEASLNSASYKPWLVDSTLNTRKKALMPLYNKFVNENQHIPADEIIKSVSFGLEMAYYDWCIAQIAKLNKKDSIVEVFEKRAKNYKHYFDSTTGFMRGKNKDNTWVAPFNPKFSSHTSSPYVEGNAWQWTWFVPHDPEGLATLYGGKDEFVQKLDSLFGTSSEIEGDEASGDITGLIGQYAHGNEPSHHISYFYLLAGKPWKTQYLLDQIMNDFYSDKPDGIIGNEDCGQMSAWYILNAMGFYQVTPGKPIYTIGRPLFDKVEIPLSSGKTFRIRIKNNSDENKYVQEVFLNNQRLQGLQFSHEDIKKGSSLEIIMGPNPKKE